MSIKTQLFRYGYLVGWQKSFDSCVLGRLLLRFHVRSQERAEKTKAAAKKRVIKRGIVQFRADAEIMELLLAVAEEKRIPYGVMCRAWVVEKLRQEKKSLDKSA